MSTPQVSDIMTEVPATCSVDDDVGTAAKALAEHDCGALPVVEDTSPRRPRGMITDRDIVMRTVAEDINPLKMKVADVMTNGALIVNDDDPVETCLNVMKDNQVRRIVVVDGTGACCGIVSQADLARHLNPAPVGDMVKQVSQPMEQASAPAG
ncbi:MAG: CBS domain-containing protein [Bacteroidetes bacterium]|nr:CBS domain-containing protein [Bacteroidota bacterium]